MAEELSGPVATSYTFDFVVAHLPKSRARVLEVGCGSGELASRLSEAGLQLVAIDSDPGCAAAAKAAGVDARTGEWPCAVDGKFDAVLFTRSLHHIHDLGGAVDSAMHVLKPGGRIIVEDFRAEGAGEAARLWFATFTAALEAAGAFGADFDLDCTVRKADVDHHENSLHSSSAIGDALRAVADVNRSDSAYFFRYLERELVSPAAAEAVLNHELALISSGALEALGKRFVATPRGSG